MKDACHELLALTTFTNTYLTKEGPARQLITPRPTTAHVILIHSLERQSAHKETARAKSSPLVLAAQF